LKSKFVKTAVAISVVMALQTGTLSAHAAIPAGLTVRDAISQTLGYLCKAPSTWVYDSSSWQFQSPYMFQGGYYAAYANTGVGYLFLNVYPSNSGVRIVAGDSTSKSILKRWKCPTTVKATYKQLIKYASLSPDN